MPILDKPPAAELALVGFVQRLKPTDDKDHTEDRGTLALLRGALADSPERQMRAWRVLARFGGIPAEGDFHRAEVVRIVAGLLAMNGLRHAPGGGSFGAACLRLLGDDERKSLHKPEQPGPVGQRMQNLLAASRDEICERVRQLGRRLERVKGGVALDFNRLHEDLRFWSDRTKAKWASDFWGANEEEPPSNPETPRE